MASGAPSRLTQMSIDVGDEQVVLERIDSVETLSRPFSITADIISPLEIDLQPHLGKPTALAVLEDSQVVRRFHGLITSAAYDRESTSGHHYRLTLQPWTYFLAQNRDMAIFQDLTVIQIIKQVTEAAGISDIEYSRLSRTRIPRAYCVQYKESDFAFISRLMEEEGIYYFFRHDAERHVMILCEGPKCHLAGDPATLEFNQNAVSVFASESKERFAKPASHLQAWTERVSTGAESRVTYRDFDFESPDQPLVAVHDSEGAHPRDDREVFHYPGRYTREKTGREDQQKTGQERSQTVLDGLRAGRRVFTGTSQAAGLACGTLVNVTKHPAARMNAAYMVTSTYHSIAAETYRSGKQGDELSFNVRFDAIPADTTYQAIQSTPRPVVQGLESAVVTGPSGETIYTDEYGRVKVRFHWDRKDTPGEKSTCWIRVSQTGGLGNLILPRVGHEVLVDFLNGDPDRPLVVGRVFNKSNMPVYPLPANKTRVLWRTLRYGQAGAYPNARPLDTGAPGANEMRFEDKGGQEEIFVHAERDMNTRVRFDETHHVGHNQGEVVGYDRTAEVGNNETVRVVHNRKTTIGDHDKLIVGKTLEISATDSILLKVGQSHVFITPTGISMTADTVSIHGKVNAIFRGMDTLVKAGANLILKGAQTFINP
ncbi:type VI secretion system secreted protein VgrG [Sphingomonas sp. PP-CE-3A-406]|nr:type VI secretion system secreted protein VgrG [Sphingomonas sp. PP-CE-3A-406]